MALKLAFQYLDDATQGVRRHVSWSVRPFFWKTQEGLGNITRASINVVVSRKCVKYLRVIAGV